MANPEFRERTNARARERWATDPEYRVRKGASAKKSKSRRYAREPEYHQSEKARVKSIMARNPRYQEAKEANHKERLHYDIEYQERQRDYQMAHKFGLRRGEYARMELEQGGLCAICRQANTNGWKLAVDHCHITHRTRGLLCHNCNVAIGKLAEKTQRMRRAMGYLLAPPFAPKVIPGISDRRLSDQRRIPNWEAQSRDKGFRKRADGHLQRRYGIGLDQYEWLLEQGKGVCWICHQPESRPSVLSVDHDKESGLIRGLLCHNCNTGIGSFRHNIKLLEEAIAYLERWALEGQG